MSRPPGKHKYVGAFLETVCIIMALALGLLIRAKLFESAYVTSRSMEPTLREGDCLLVNRQIYKRSKPRRGDIVVAQHPTEAGDDVVKRVVGLPGERILLWDGRFLINRKLLVEPYLRQIPLREGPQGWTVPRDSYFLLGDNRNFSEDSRDYGPLPLKSIVGKAVLTYYPLRRFRRL